MQRLLEYIHTEVVTKIIPGAEVVPLPFIYIGGLFLVAGLILGWMSVIAMFWIWAERRVSGFIQARYGPNRVGPAGLLQSLADGIKLIAKEDIIPYKANRFLYEFAPLLVFVGAFIPFAALPFSQHIVIADLNLGLFFILAFGSIEVIGVLMAGWAPNSKWSLYGGMRLAAQLLSYEIPLGLSLLCIVVLSGTLNMTDLVLWQTQGFLIWDNAQTPWIIDFVNWGIFRAFPFTIPAFVIFYIAALAESKRAPFDLPEAESELVSGFHTEYTGIRFSYFFLAEYCAMYVVCLLGAVVFLGGWHWPLPATYDIVGATVLGHTVEDPQILATITTKIAASVEWGYMTEWAGAGLTDRVLIVLGDIWTAIKILIWHGPIATITTFTDRDALLVVFNELFGFFNLVGKSFVLLFMMLWIRWTLPRVRIDQVMHLCLKVLLPLGLVCLVGCAFFAVMMTPYEPIDFRARAVDRGPSALEIAKAERAAEVAAYEAQLLEAEKKAAEKAKAAEASGAESPEPKKEIPAGSLTVPLDSIDPETEWDDGFVNGWE